MKKYFNRYLLGLFTMFLFISAYQVEAKSQTAVCVTKAPVFLDNPNSSAGVIIRWQVLNDTIMTDLARGPMSGVFSSNLDNDGKLEFFHGVYQQDKAALVAHYIVKKDPKTNRWQITYISRPADSKDPAPSFLQIEASRNSYPLFCRMDYSWAESIYSPNDATLISKDRDLLDKQFLKPEDKEVLKIDKKAYYPVINSSIYSSSGGSGGSPEKPRKVDVNLLFCAFKDSNDKIRYASWLEKIKDEKAQTVGTSIFFNVGSSTTVDKAKSKLEPYTVTLEDAEHQDSFTFNELPKGSQIQTANLRNVLNIPETITNLTEIKGAAKRYLSVDITTGEKISSKGTALCYMSSVDLDNVDTLASIKVMASVINPNGLADKSVNIHSQLDLLEATNLYYCAFKGHSKIRYVSWGAPDPVAVLPFIAIKANLKQALSIITLDDERLPGQYTTLTLAQQNINDSEEISKLTSNLATPKSLDLKDAEKQLWHVSGKYKGTDIESQPALCYKLLRAARTAEEAKALAKVVADSVKNSWPTDPSLVQSTSSSSSSQAEDYAICVSKIKNPTEVSANWKLNLNTIKDPLSINIRFDGKSIVSGSDNKHIVVNYSDVGGYVSKIYNNIGNSWILGKDNENPVDKAWTLAVLGHDGSWSKERLSCTLGTHTIRWDNEVVRRLAIYRFSDKYTHFNYCFPETPGNISHCIAQGQNEDLPPDDGRHEMKHD